MIDYAALETEIDTDPEDLGYAPFVTAGDDQSIAELLNEKQYRGPVPIIELSSYCIINGLIGACEVAAQKNDTPDLIKAVCITATTLLRDDFRLTYSDTDDASFSTVCDTLIGASLMTSDQKSAMIAMGNNRNSRAEVLFGQNVRVTNTDVSFALRGAR